MTATAHPTAVPTSVGPSAPASAWVWNAATTRFECRVCGAQH